MGVYYKMAKIIWFLPLVFLLVGMLRMFCNLYFLHIVLKIKISGFFHKKPEKKKNQSIGYLYCKSITLYMNILYRSPGWIVHVLK